MQRYWLTVLFVSICINLLAQSPSKPNFIVIYVDDLNDYLGILEGHPQTITPNIDAIGASGINFTNSHTNAPGCAPARTSFFSGKDCEYTQVVYNDDYFSRFRMNFSEARGNELVYTLPEILKDSGNYYTYAINKAYHTSQENDFDITSTPTCEKSQSWNDTFKPGERESFDSICNTFADYSDYNWGIIPNELEDSLVDRAGTDAAINFIQSYADGSLDDCGKDAFFLTIGYFRPHTPRYFPESFFLSYYMDSIEGAAIQSPINNSDLANVLNGLIMPPQTGIPYSIYNSYPTKSIQKQMADGGTPVPSMEDYLGSIGDLPLINDSLTIVENFNLHLEYQRANYVMGYLAAVNYVDYEIGRIMDSLSAYPDILNNTYIILTSDHGYGLGERNHYTKWALWETDLRVPLIISGPGILSGTQSSASVSTLDIFPTVLDLAGVDYPVDALGGDYLDGVSLTPLISKPYRRWTKPSIATTIRGDGPAKCYRQYSVRTNDHHLIRYRKNNDGSMPLLFCDEDSVYYDYELYEIGAQREIDPNEWNNLAGQDEYQPLIQYLETFLPGGSHYLQKVHTAEIKTISVPGCFLDNTGKIKLKAKVYDTDGNPMPTTGLQLEWSNSINSTKVYGNKFSLNLATIHPAFFSIKDSLFIYLTVIDPITNDTIAFSHEYYFLNSSNSPSSNFIADLEGKVLTIDSLAYNGSIKSVIWDMGDGNSYTQEYPLKYEYSGPGTYDLEQTIVFGNGCSLSQEKRLYINELTEELCSSFITLPDGEIVSETGIYFVELTSTLGEDSVIIFTIDDCSEVIAERYSKTGEIEIVPNPASQSISIHSLLPFNSIRIFDINGRLVLEKLLMDNFNFYDINLNGLPTGMLTIELKGEEVVHYSKLVHIE